MPQALTDAVGTGAPILLILGLLSLISLALIAVKTAQLWPARGQGANRDKALRAWEAGQGPVAHAQLAGARTPADRVIARALELIESGVSHATLLAELIRMGNDEIAALHRHIRLLEMIAMVSPLLGLLGTVLGMIQSFQELELAQGAANASVLAGGIWQALLTTAAGLIVAIPAAAAASLFTARIESAAQEIESAVGRLTVIEERKRGAG